ncbi:MAG: hypothetical protein GF333_07990 [Candidatus Omnitrophica bacterium]|nr:hypothetical protein [Candidatus Omnitrophota bacterium]
MLRKIRKAQSTLEYALLIGVVVGALLTMQSYLKRSVMGKVMSTADDIGDPYSPGLTFRNEITNLSQNSQEVVQGGINGTTTTTVTGGEQTSFKEHKLKFLEDEEWVSGPAEEE